MPETHTYRAYGLRVAAPFACPELRPASGAPDVAVRYGDVPETLAATTTHGAAFQATPDELLLQLPTVGRFLVRHGREIVIAPDARTDDDAIRVFLLGSCFGALLQQRGLLTLHASAVRTPHGAVLLLGDSGAGKSTLAAALVRRGAGIIADDIAAVTVDDDGRPVVLPAGSHVKLWADAAEQLGDDVGGLRRVRPGLDKFAVPVGPGGATEAGVEAGVPVHRAYVLQPHHERDLRFEPVDGADRFTWLTRHTYRHRFLDPAVRLPEHFRIAAVTAARTPVTIVRRPRAPFLLDELADRLAADADLHAS